MQRRLALMGARRFRVAAALTSAVLTIAGCASHAATRTAAAAGGAWTELPSAPLSPRLGAVAAWTGAEVLFLGGDVDDLCPPNASCSGPAESAPDGAAFDPATQTWRAVAEAPHPIPAGTSSTVAGDTVFLAYGDRLLSYDGSEDAWSVSPATPGGHDVGDPTALDDGTVAVLLGERSEGDPSGLVYDPADRTWSELPEDPLGPSFDRALTAVPGALVLTAAPTPHDWPSVDMPSVTAAVLDLDSGTWRSLGDSGRTGGWRWSWTGERMIDVYPDGVTGSGDPVTQGGALDPGTGTWSRLPGTPSMDTGGWPVDAAGGPVSAVDGWLYDDADGSWTSLPRPPDAPAEPGAGVWAGDRLVVMGGLASDEGWTEHQLTNRAWAWQPRGGDPPP